MGWYNLWIGHDDLKRFIKRKDSDAGEAGTLLLHLGFLVFIYDIDNVNFQFVCLQFVCNVFDELLLRMIFFQLRICCFVISFLLNLHDYLLDLSCFDIYGKLFHRCSQVMH